MEMTVLKKAMTDSISEVLETMFFLPIDFIGGDKIEDLWDAENKDLTAAKLEFSGPFSGRIYFIMPVSQSRSITESFIGMDEITDKHCAEAVNEIINMVAGNAFSILDSEAVFDLGIPQVANFKEIVMEKSDPEKTIFVPVNTLDEIMAFQLVLN